MLTFIGLGLYDAGDISVKGLTCIRKADRVYLETYTSKLMGSSIHDLERCYGRSVHLLRREDIEEHPDELLAESETGRVVMLCAGDPMVSTTHTDLRMRAAARGITTSIIHGSSILSAVSGISGLQNYRFGKSCSLPFPRRNWAPTAPIEVIGENISLRLHTLVYLDIHDERYMTVPEAITLLEGMSGTIGLEIPLYVGIARAGSDDPFVRAGTADALISLDFGPPLHVLVVPADLHDMEREYLEMFAAL